MQTNGLVKLCPLLQGLFFTSHRVGHQSFAKKLMELLQSNQVVVVSGTGKDSLGTNCGLYKTTILRTEFLNDMERKGKKVCYFDLAIRLDFQAVAFGAGIDPIKFSRNLADLDEADIYIFDEANLVFLKNEYSAYLNDDIYACSQAFWEKVQQLMTADKKIIFVTALHPQNQRYKDFRYNETMLEFFQAPVIELS